MLHIYPGFEKGEGLNVKAISKKKKKKLPRPVLKDR